MVVPFYFKNRFWILFLLYIAGIQFSFSQQNRILISADTVAYKKIDTTTLNLHVYKPLNFKKENTYNCI
ncbi:MAG: hypothetical protein P8H19_04830, partial [Polaribacter sp.]|nr:hypothetical protein [Polaribacter sp.]